MSKLRQAVGCLSFFLGGGVGLVIGSGASYAIAGLITDSRETQAYLAVLIVPAIALVGAMTVAASIGAMAQSSAPRLLATVPGWLVLIAAVLLAVQWSRPARPATVLVRNDTRTPIQNLYLGSDFRRNSRIGDLAAGATSPPIPVDLANRVTFNALEGRAAGDYVRHRLSPDQTADLADGTYLWTVGGEPGALTYRFEAIGNTHPAP